jgi:hypothetical protein
MSNKELLGELLDLDSDPPAPLNDPGVVTMTDSNGRFGVIVCYPDRLWLEYQL